MLMEIKLPAIYLRFGSTFMEMSEITGYRSEIVHILMVIIFTEK